MIIMVATSLAVLLAEPALPKNLYYGKLWSTQARFYAIEARCDLAISEKSLFSLNNGRRKWSTTTSLQSQPSKTGAYYEGMNPHKASTFPEQDQEGSFLFTLIDTYVLEATIFYADWPPSVVMICGREGGMQRAVLYSYDWRTQTFNRGVVLRMKTIVLNRMSRAHKFRFALRREGDLEKSR